MSETCIRKAELAPSLPMPGFSEECLPCVLLCYHTLHSSVALSNQCGQNSAAKDWKYKWHFQLHHAREEIVLLSCFCLTYFSWEFFTEDCEGYGFSSSQLFSQAEAHKSTQNHREQGFSDTCTGQWGSAGVLSLCCFRTESWSRYLTGCTNWQVSSLLTHWARDASFHLLMRL